MNIAWWALCAALLAGAPASQAQTIDTAKPSGASVAASEDDSEDLTTLRQWWDTPVWQNPNRGYQWYPPEPTPKASKPAEAPKAVPADKPKDKPAKVPEKAADKSLKPLNPNAKISDFKSTKEVNAHLEALKDLAVMKPTSDHVKAYYAFQMQVLDQGSTFADVAKRVVWTTPELDYSNRRPVVNAAALTFNARELEKVRATSSKLAKTHGMFFFFRSDCPYCHQMGPLLREFAQRTGMEILPVSLDGGPLPDWPNARPNNGIAEKLQVTTVPAMYLLDKSQGQVQPIAFGVTSLSSLMERIHVLTQSTPGQEF